MQGGFKMKCEDCKNFEKKRELGDLKFKGRDVWVGPAKVASIAGLEDGCLYVDSEYKPEIFKEGTFTYIRFVKRNINE